MSNTKIKTILVYRFIVALTAEKSEINCHFVQLATIPVGLPIHLMPFSCASDLVLLTIVCVYALHLVIYLLSYGCGWVNVSSGTGPKAVKRLCVRVCYLFTYVVKTALFNALQKR